MWCCSQKTIWQNRLNLWSKKAQEEGVDRARSRSSEPEERGGSVWPFQLAAFRTTVIKPSTLNFAWIPIMQQLKHWIYNHLYSLPPPSSGVLAFFSLCQFCFSSASFSSASDLFCAPSHISSSSLMCLAEATKLMKHMMDLKRFTTSFVPSEQKHCFGRYLLQLFPGTGCTCYRPRLSWYAYYFETEI